MWWRSLIRGSVGVPKFVRILFFFFSPSWSSWLYNAAVTLYRLSSPVLCPNWLNKTSVEKIVVQRRKVFKVSYTTRAVTAPCLAISAAMIFLWYSLTCLRSLLPLARPRRVISSFAVLPNLIVFLAGSRTSSSLQSIACNHQERIMRNDNSLFDLPVIT